jgi:ribonuclease HI
MSQTSSNLLKKIPTVTVKSSNNQILASKLAPFREKKILPQDVKIADWIESLESLEDHQEHNYDFKVTTDGACRGNPGPGAWGYIIQNHLGQVLHYEADAYELTTNNQMELMSFLESLRWIKSYLHNFGEKIIWPEVRIYLVSDSQYLINGLKSWMASWKKRGWKKADNKIPENLGFWQELDQIVGEIKSLDFTWVKGHSGHLGNEFCDQLANKILDQALSLKNE